MKCEKATNQISIDEHLESNAAPEEVASELPESSPRLVLHRYNIAADGGPSRVLNVFIYYNPLSCSIEMKRLSSSARDVIKGSFEDIKVCSINFSLFFFFFY